MGVAAYTFQVVQSYCNPHLRLVWSYSFIRNGCFIQMVYLNCQGGSTSIEPVEGWDLWRSSWVNALVAVATIPTSEPSGPEKFGRSFGVFFFVCGRGPDLETRDGHIWDVFFFFFWGGEEEGSWVFRPCQCFLLIFVEVNWRSVVTTPWRFSGFLEDSWMREILQLHLDGLAGSRKQRRLVKEKISSNPETFGNHKLTFWRRIS